MDIWDGIGRVMRGVFSGMLRGVSNPREGSKIITFLYRPRLVCSSFLNLLCSWKDNSANYFALTEFYEVHIHDPAPPVSAVWPKSTCRGDKATLAVPATPDIRGRHGRSVRGGPH